MVRASAVRTSGVTVLVAVGAGSPTVTVVPPTSVSATAVSNARAFPAASTTTVARTPAASASAGPYTSEAPSSSAWSRFPATASTPMTLPSPRETAVMQGGHPDPAEPDHEDGVPLPRLSGVDHGAAAGQHGAAQDGRDVRRHVVVDGHQGAPVDDGVVGEGRDAQVVVHRVSVPVQPAAAGEQLAAGVGGAAEGAREPAVGGAVRAGAAPGQERHHHPLAGGQVVDAVPDPDNPARGLVSEQHRHRARPDAVDHGEVGVAESGRLDTDENLSLAGLLQVELDDLEGSGQRIGTGSTGLRRGRLR